MNNVFSYPIHTSGEAVYIFLRGWLRKGVSVSDSLSWLSSVYRAEEWREYIEQLIAVAITGQVVAAGRTYRERHDTSAPFDTEFRAYLHGTLLIERFDANRLFRLATVAVDESRRGIPQGLARQLRTWAATNHNFCYLCGRPLDFNDREADRAYTADHIWPLSSGGDSIEENLLPACFLCNNAHKLNLATWAMTSVQSVILGLEPPPSALAKVSGVARFALHHRRAQQLAIDAKLSLKNAYMQLGPSEDLRTVDRDEVAHFFNLANHNITIDSF